MPEAERLEYFISKMVEHSTTLFPHQGIPHRPPVQPFQPILVEHSTQLPVKHVGHFHIGQVLQETDPDGAGTREGTIWHRDCCPRRRTRRLRWTLRARRRGFFLKSAARRGSLGTEIAGDSYKPYWRSGRALAALSKGRGFEPQRRFLFPQPRGEALLKKLPQQGVEPTTSRLEGRRTNHSGRRLPCHHTCKRTNRAAGGRRAQAPCTLMLILRRQRTIASSPVRSNWHAVVPPAFSALTQR